MGISSDLAMALDPVAFARSVGFDPDPWQEGVLHSTSRRVLLCCSRQSGKSTVTAHKALHRAVYWPGSLVLICSQNQEQSKELLRKVDAAYNALGHSVQAESETKQRLELSNGSRIIALCSKEHSVRGYSAPDLIIVDEAAKCEDELYYSALYPMLTISRGQFMCLSSPYGKRGFFYQEWSEGEGWERYEVPATQCPRITPEILKQAKRDIGWLRFEQEYMCKFHEPEGSIFMYEDIAAMLTPEVTPLFSTEALEVA